MSEPYLQIKNLNYQVNGQEILRDISFDVKKGEILVVIDLMGVGKQLYLNQLLEL